MANEHGLGAVVVGPGFGVLTHGAALRAAGFELKALVGRNPERTVERAKHAEIPFATTNLDEALALPGVDLVSIATPPHTHAEIALKAIAAGKHVLLEKPFARDLGEARQLLEAAEAAGIVHCVGHEHRFDPGQALLTRLVDQGAIGTPKMVLYLLQLPMFQDPSTTVPEWWSDREQGGGWLGAQGTHVFDHMRRMFGDFAGVRAHLPTMSSHGWNVEDTFSVSFRTKSGVEGLLQSSIAVYGRDLYLNRVMGSEGTVALEGPMGEISLHDKDGLRDVEHPPDLANPAYVRPAKELMNSSYELLSGMSNSVPPYTRYYEAIRDRILGVDSESDMIPATFADGLAVQEIYDACLRSDREGGWIELG